MNIMENNNIEATGLPAGTDPSTVKSLDADGLNKLVAELAKAMSPGLNAAAEKAVAERMKAFTSQPPPGVIAKNGAATERETDSLASEYFRHKLVPGYTAKGRSNLEEIERALAAKATPDFMAKVGLTGSDTNSGAELVATQYVRELVAAIPNIAPFRDYVHVHAMTDDTVQIPQMTTAPSAGRKGQNVTGSATTIATAKKSLVATTQIAITPQISLELAADDRSNFMAQMALWLGRANAQADTRDFTIGDGTGEPQGIINVTGRDIGMVSTTLTYDDIVNLIHGVGQQYRSLPKVAFAFNNSGIAKVRKIKDDNGRPILVEGTGPGLPARIFGYPVLELPDLPGDGSNATNETSGYFGCWELFYWWGDRQLLQIASDVSGPNFLANSMQLRSTTRSDGRIVLTDAIVRIVGVK